MQITCTSRRRLVGLLAGLATVATVGAAQAQSTLEQARADGYIRVGFANEAPYGFATPDGKLTGESPEVVKAVLKKIGIDEVDGVLTEFGSLIPGLQAGRFDIIAAGMFITPSAASRSSSPSRPMASARRSWCPRAIPRGSRTTARSPTTAI